MSKEIHTISLGQIIPTKSKYKTFSEVKPGEYLYIYDREQGEVYFMRVDEVLDYDEYMKRDPERHPEIRKDNTINITQTSLFGTSYFWFKDKENQEKKNPKPGYFYYEKYAGQYVNSSNFISSFQSFNWFIVGYDYKLPYRSMSWICTTPDEILKLLNVDQYHYNKIVKDIIYDSIS